MQPNDPIAPTNNDTPTPDTETNPEQPVETVNPVTTDDTSSFSKTTEVPTSGQVVAPTFTTDQSPKKNFLKSKKTKLMVIVAGLVVLLGGGGAAAYYSLVLPNKPQRIAQQAIANTIDQEKVKSGYFEGEVAFSGGEIANTLSSISFKGASNQEGAIDMTLIANTAVTKINFDLRSTDSKTLYLRLTGLEGLDKLLGTFAGETSDEESAAMLATLAPIITQVNNQWFSVEESLLNQLGGDAVPLSSDTKVTSEDAKKIGDIYKKNQFLQIDKRLDDQKIHDIDSYHIQATINKDKMIAFLSEVKSANIKALPIEQSMIDEIAKVDFSKYPFEMWVSKSGRFITQLATSIEEQGTTVKVRVALYDINKEVKVEQPQDSKSILELLSGLAPLAGGLLGGESASDMPLEDSLSL